MDLADALGMDTSAVVAFVGAGGKKTAMQHLTATGTDAGLTVGYTTTTAMPPPPDLPLVLTGEEPQPSALAEASPSMAFAKERVSNPERVDRKVRGFEPNELAQLFERSRFDWLLVKADGARKREFKAPGPHEPVVPPIATTVVPVASTAAIGEPLTERTVHRPERVAALTSLELGDAITADAVGTVLTHPAGGVRNVPADAEVVPMVNKADTAARRTAARAALTHGLSQSQRCNRGVVTSFESDCCDVVQTGVDAPERR